MFGQGREQEFPPLLFSVASQDGPTASASAEYRTPRHSTPIRGSELTLSGFTPSRRSATPPGSLQAETPPPPPTRTLQDDVTGEDVRFATSLIPVEQPVRYQDCWVTVFGFQPGDIPIVLKEMQLCGDIVRWGTFGQAGNVNWLHVQYQDQHAAMKALLRNGEQISSCLMIGVKPVGSRHRQAIEQYAAQVDPEKFTAQMPLPARPHRIDAFSSQTQPMPVPEQSITSKFRELLFGL